MSARTIFYDTSIINMGREGDAEGAEWVGTRPTVAISRDGWAGHPLCKVDG